MSDESPKRIENAQGVVKWFDPRKGYGFIVGPDGQDIFVHYSKISGEGYRVLKDGAAVTYDAELGDKGWQATRATRVEEGAEVVVKAKPGVARSPRR
ncbi:MAG: cold shock domain-containing protein [Planctomycetota bacterium]|nr:MAG: cold shock domain-containing protein [Planctomycetota bacterium]